MLSQIEQSRTECVCVSGVCLTHGKGHVKHKNDGKIKSLMGALEYNSTYKYDDGDDDDGGGGDDDDDIVATNTTIAR